MNISNSKDPILENSPLPTNEERRKYVVVADDNIGDRILIKLALVENQMRGITRFVGDGLELVELLERCKPTDFHPGNPLPCLILLDLYMPRVNGHEALKIIKNDTVLRRIPIVILTASHAYSDVAQSYSYGANSFLRKPLEYKNLVQLVEVVKKYWLEIAYLPV